MAAGCTRCIGIQCVDKVWHRLNSNGLCSQGLTIYIRQYIVLNILVGADYRFYKLVAKFGLRLQGWSTFRC